MDYSRPIRGFKVTLSATALMLMSWYALSVIKSNNDQMKTGLLTLVIKKVDITRAGRGNPIEVGASVGDGEYSTFLNVPQNFTKITYNFANVSEGTEVIVRAKDMVKPGAGCACPFVIKELEANGLLGDFHNYTVSKDCTILMKSKWHRYKY